MFRHFYMVEYLSMFLGTVSPDGSGVDANRLSDPDQAALALELFSNVQNRIRARQGFSSSPDELIERMEFLHPRGAMAFDPNLMRQIRQDLKSLIDGNDISALVDFLSINAFENSGHLASALMIAVMEKNQEKKRAFY